MARPREFDSDVALERVMQAFWARGYRATSLDALCTATGLSRSSLYAAYGGKRELLLRSIDRYEQQATARIRAALARPVPVRQAIRDFVRELIDRIVNGPGRAGCFIGNCAGELAHRDRSAANRVRRSMQNIESLFADALRAGQQRGELAPGVDTAATARFLVAGIQGLRLVGKANADREALESIADTLMKCLDIKEN
jgi:TetR/AcrR family transcriptional repressor of nem operon